MGKFLLIFYKIAQITFLLRYLYSLIITPNFVVIKSNELILRFLDKFIEYLHSFKEDSWLKI